MAGKSDPAEQEQERKNPWSNLELDGADGLFVSVLHPEPGDGRIFQQHRNQDCDGGEPEIGLGYAVDEDLQGFRRRWDGISEPAWYRIERDQQQAKIDDLLQEACAGRWLGMSHVYVELRQAGPPGGAHLVGDLLGPLLAGSHPRGALHPAGGGRAPPLPGAGPGRRRRLLRQRPPARLL